MVLQIGCPISPTAEFVKEADQYGDDINHTLAEIDPKPDQVTVTIGTTVMNSLTIDVAAEPIVGQAPASLSLELFKNLRTNGIQPYFEMAHACQLDDLEQLIRAGAYQGPVNHLLTATGGSRFFGRNPFDFIEYVRRSPPGSMMTMESNGRTGAPFAAMSIALGVHARCGIKEKPEDWQGERKSLVQQVSQIARLAKELKRPVASGQQAREMSQLGVCYDSTEETLDALGLPPNPKNGQAGFFVKDGRPGGTPTRSERRN
jgi:uncharacterized protein (DUF849 family)